MAEIRLLWETPRDCIKNRKNRFGWWLKCRTCWWLLFAEITTFGEKFIKCRCVSHYFCSCQICFWNIHKFKNKLRSFTFRYWRRRLRWNNMIREKTFTNPHTNFSHFKWIFFSKSHEWGWYKGFELIRGACIASVPNKGSRYRHYYFR